MGWLCSGDGICFFVLTDTILWMVLKIQGMMKEKILVNEPEEENGLESK